MKPSNNKKEDDDSSAKAAVKDRKQPKQQEGSLVPGRSKMTKKPPCSQGNFGFGFGVPNNASGFNNASTSFTFGNTNARPPPTTSTTGGWSFTTTTTTDSSSSSAYYYEEWPSSHHPFVFGDSTTTRANVAEGGFNGWGFRFGGPSNVVGVVVEKKNEGFGLVRRSSSGGVFDSRTGAAAIVTTHAPFCFGPTTATATRRHYHMTTSGSSSAKGTSVVVGNKTTAAEKEGDDPSPAAEVPVAGEEGINTMSFGTAPPKIANTTNWRPTTSSSRSNRLNDPTAAAAAKKKAHHDAVPKVVYTKTKKTSKRTLLASGKNTSYRTNNIPNGERSGATTVVFGILSLAVGRLGVPLLYGFIIIGIMASLVVVGGDESPLSGGTMKFDWLSASTSSHRNNSTTVDNTTTHLVERNNAKNVLKKAAVECRNSISCFASGTKSMIKAGALTTELLVTIILQPHVFGLMIQKTK